MNPYQKLLSNTVLFSVSTFGSKVMVFLLMPFYTRVLSSAEYGTTDLLIQAGNLLIPLASIGISDAVIRFGLEKSADKKCVFTVGLLTTLAGFGLLLLAEPLLREVQFLDGYTSILLLYVLMANLHTHCCQFARATGHVRLFAADGILRTALTVALNLLLLAVFPCGVAGYVLANAAADGLAAICVFLLAGQWRYFSLSALRKSTAAEMLCYCVPLIPTTVCSWIINISDRYLIAFLVGSEANGIYAVANKIPTILFLVASIFASAWQLSAVSDQSKRMQERFFTNIFRVYQAVSFVVASGLILTARISTRLLAAPSYYDAWRYIPMLVLAATFACLGSFFSSIYMVEKRSIATLVTTLLGASVNIVGNLLLIPSWGVMGAAAATLVSYILIFTVRVLHTRSMLRIEWNGLWFCFQMVLLTVQCLVMAGEPRHWPLWSGLCFLLVAAVNGWRLLSGCKKRCPGR